ncbi:hypothetical protein Tco_0126519 [Tanacetum coccineum]
MSFITNLSSYDSVFISEVPVLEPNQDNSILDNGVQEMYYSEQPNFDPASDIEITSDRNIIAYDQYLKETESAALQNTASTEQPNDVIMSVFDEITNQVAKYNAESIKNNNVHESLTAKLERYMEMVRMFEERQKDLDKLSEHFGKHFIPQKELSAEQAFWLPISNTISEQLVVLPTPVKIEVPSELPKDFDNGLHSELNEVKMVINQMEAAVEQCSVDKKCFEIQKKELLLEND